MKKRAILLYLVMLILFAAASGTAVGFLRVKTVGARYDSIERRSTPDGTVYEIISTEDDGLCLRVFSKDGAVSGYYPLPDTADSSRFPAYHIVGVIADEIFLYGYETTGNTPELVGETVYAYNVTDGTQRIAADIPSPGGLDEFIVFYAPDTAGGRVIMAYLNRYDGFLTIKSVDVFGGGVTEMNSAEAAFPLSAVAVSEAGVLYALSGDSRVYRLDGGVWHCLFEPGPGEAAVSMNTGADGNVYLFTASPGGTRLLVLSAGGESFRDTGLDTGGFVRIYVSDPGNWIALDESHGYIVSANGARHTVQKLSVRYQVLFDTDTLIPAAAGTAVLLAAFTAIRRTMIKRKLRLLTKLIIIIIPLFAVCIFVLITLAAGTAILTAEKGTRESLSECAFEVSEEIDGARFAQISRDEPYNDEYFIELREYLGKLSEYNLLQIRSGHGYETHNAYTSFWLYRIENGSVYTSICGRLTSGLEAKYTEYTLDTKARDEMIETREPVSAYVRGLDSNVPWTAVLMPILADGELVGYLETARPLVGVDESVRRVTTAIVRAGLAVFAAVVTALVIVLTLSTKTLGKLTRGAAAVSGGDYTVRIKSRSWDETGEIAAAFNKMAQSVGEAVSDITAVSRGYNRFVPGELIELLGKPSIKSVSSGDHTALTATHVLLYTDSFDSLGNTEFFDALGRFYNTVIPAVRSCGGLITQYSQRGLIAMFEKAPETALQPLFSIFESLDRTRGAACHMFMSYSGAMLGVTGNSELLNIVTVSRLIYESHNVGKACKQFGTRLITAESAFKEMGDSAGKYHYRFIGYLKADSEMRRLYDFYDCDRPEIKIKKDELKDLFEAGVRLYYEKEYSKSRRIFVEILKKFPEDTAAREYLSLAHAGHENGGEPLPVITLDKLIKL